MPRQKKQKVAKKFEEPRALTKLLQFLAWLTGAIVSLAVAFGMIDGVLTVRFIPLAVMVFFGWVVVITTLLGVLVAVINYFFR